MLGIYEELLVATIQHLEDLKARGIKFVSISRETLAALADAVAQRSRAPSRGPTGAEATGVAPSLQYSQQSQQEFVAPVSLPVPPSSEGAAFPEPPIKLPERSLVPAGASLGPEAKATAFAELRERALACVKCPHLANSRKNVVFGVGDIHSPLMFVGEAPGADEDVQGEPFVGKAGQLLTRIIQTMGFSRNTVYIANVLKCRPDTPGQSAGNRKPTPEEMKTCLPYLNAQIDLIQPKVIVALGATAVEGLLGRPVGITRLRGNWQEFRSIPIMPTYHPSYLLRNQALSVKRELWEDMLQVMERLGAPISDKQRNYFLNA